MTRLRVGVIWTLILLLAAACSGRPSDPSEKSSPTSSSIIATEASSSAPQPEGGQLWEGEIHATNDVMGTCTFTWDGRLRFTVSADGAINGTADVTASGCNGIGGSYPVGGHTTTDGFALTSTAYFMKQVTLTRTENRASGPTTYEDPYNHVVGQIEVTCTTC